MSGWGIKYLEAFRGCVNNFIARKEAFMSSKTLFGLPFITLLFNTIDNLVKNGLEVKKELEAVFALEFYVTVIENYPGKINEVIPNVLKKCVNYLKINTGIVFRSGIYQVVSPPYFLPPPQISHPPQIFRSPWPSGTTHR